MAHTEAPSSVTYKLETPQGFNVLFTVRDESEVNLLRKMEELEMRFIDENYDSQSGGTRRKKPAKTKQGLTKCPECNGDLIQGEKRDGTPFVKCENNVWDKNLRKNVGSCDFIKWDTTKGGTTAQGEQATESQKGLILGKWPHEWKQGMSKKEASDLISSKFNK